MAFEGVFGITFWRGVLAAAGDDDWPDSTDDPSFCANDMTLCLASAVVGGGNGEIEIDEIEAECA